MAGLLCLPTAIFQKHVSLRHGGHLCREQWPSVYMYEAYTVLLDLTLLVLPVVVMSVAYSRVVAALLFASHEPVSVDVAKNGQGQTYILRPTRPVELKTMNGHSCRSVTSCTSSNGSVAVSKARTFWSKSGSNQNASRKSAAQPQHSRIRHSNPERIRRNKIRVIRMLLAVILEFFVCWTPIYVLNTWMVFDIESAHQVVSPLSKILFHLLSYVSSCCNPITYCFMNKKFREAFIRAFTCRSTSLDRQFMRSGDQYRSTTRWSERSGFQSGRFNSTAGSAKNREQGEATRLNRLPSAAVADEDTSLSND